MNATHKDFRIIKNIDIQFITQKNGDGYVCSGGKARVADNGIHTMEYRFGSHRLDIGNALDKIVDLMENDLEYLRDTMFGGVVSCYLPSDNDDLDDGLVWSK